MNQVEGSTLTAVTWRINGEESSIPVIVRDGGDQFANVSEHFAKSGQGTQSSGISVVDGQVRIAAAAADKEYVYTLRINSPEPRPGYSISDQLPAGMSYVDGSFAASIVTWDANGLNRETGAFDAFAPTVAGNSFSSTTDIPGPSELTITYKAKLTDIPALEALLQTEYGKLGGGTGNYGINLVNTATFGETERTGTLRLQGNVPGLNVGSAFGKTASWSSKNVVTDEDGELLNPLPIDYTISANLAQWDGRPNFTLSKNVVIKDVLPAQANWLSTQDDFITVTGITLTKASECPTDEADFAAETYVGQYCVDGQKLLINIGKDSSTNAKFVVKAQINTVEGLSVSGWTPIQDAVSYQLRNTASFDYCTGNPYTANRDVQLVKLPDTSEGLNDSSVFTKSGQARAATIKPGESVTVDYSFKLEAGKGIDVRTSKIVDYIDDEIFDLSDLSAVTVSGSYDYQWLDASHFALSTDDDGNLVIELNAKGVQFVDTRGADKHYQVNISMTTVPFDGKQTKTITNRATLFGVDDVPLYWSKTESEATSYGDEAEVRKRVYDNANKEWVASLNADLNDDGSMVQTKYVYRIEFIPHGSYNSVKIVSVNDLLPDAVDFLGFVDEGAAGDPAAPVADTVDIGGNLQASYDSETRTVTLFQKPGTVLKAGGKIAAYVAVEVNDPSAPIVNRIGDTSATIVPLKKVSVGDYVWFDANRDGIQDAGEKGIEGVVLTIVGPDGEPVTDVYGEPVGPTSTDEDGKYTFENLPPLTGDDTYTVKIDREASADVLDPYVPTLEGAGDNPGLDSSTWEATTVPNTLMNDGARDPKLDFGFQLKSYAIGDFVWIDANRNGIQDEGEDVLPGVKVELLQDGKVIKTTTTDEDGLYVFDDLLAGTYQVKFTLTDEQAQRYEFTKRDAGRSDAVDSDANRDGLTRTIVLDDDNSALTGDYPYASINASQGIDPTWDAGVVVKIAKPGGLPTTGVGMNVGLILGAAGLLGAAGVAVVRRKK